MSITEWCIGNAGRQSFADNAYGNKINANSVCVNIYFACFGSVFHGFGNFHRGKIYRICQRSSNIYRESRSVLFFVNSLFFIDLRPPSNLAH
jgi:hypothetical protein